MTYSTDLSGFDLDTITRVSHLSELSPFLDELEELDTSVSGGRSSEGSDYPKFQYRSHCPIRDYSHGRSRLMMRWNDDLPKFMCQYHGRLPLKDICRVLGVYFIPRTESITLQDVFSERRWIPVVSGANGKRPKTGYLQSHSSSVFENACKMKHEDTWIKMSFSDISMHLVCNGGQERHYRNGEHYERTIHPWVSRDQISQDEITGYVLTSAGSFRSPSRIVIMDLDVREVEGGEQEQLRIVRKVEEWWTKLNIPFRPSASGRGRHAIAVAGRDFSGASTPPILLDKDLEIHMDIYPAGSKRYVALTDDWENLV